MPNCSESDLRRDRRFPFDRIFPLSCQAKNGGTRVLLVRGRDISDTGIRVLCSEPLEVSATVFLRIEDEGLVGNAVVRHCCPSGSGYLAGLRFSGFVRPQADAPGAGRADFYEVLQVDPNADLDTIHRVYRFLAARLHPDNTETGDADKFLLLQKAYTTLSNPATRQAYDAQYQGVAADASSSFTPHEFIDDVWGESRRRLAILCILYHRRRNNPDHPAVGLLEFMQVMSCDQETLVFSLWYLKEKRYVETAGGSDYSITVAGVERVEAEAPAARAVCKLLESARPPAPATEASPAIM